MTTLIISNEEMDDIMKIVKLLENSGLLIKGVSERIKNKAKKQSCISSHVIRYIRRQFTGKSTNITECKVKYLDLSKIKDLA